MRLQQSCRKHWSLHISRYYLHDKLDRLSEYVRSLANLPNRVQVKLLLKCDVHSSVETIQTNINKVYELVLFLLIR
jgi:hypothetical protein